MKRGFSDVVEVIGDVSVVRVARGNAAYACMFVPMGPGLEVTGRRRSIQFGNGRAVMGVSVNARVILVPKVARLFPFILDTENPSFEGRFLAVVYDLRGVGRCRRGRGRVCAWALVWLKVVAPVLFTGWLGHP